MSDNEHKGLDIDWFFTNNDDVAFVASGGGKLPQSITKSEEERTLLALFFRNLPVISEVIVNRDLSKFVMSAIDERYLSDFMYMTKRGLFSFDKTILNNSSDSHYHLVAAPVTQLKFDQLPDVISGILKNTIYSGNIELIMDSNFII